MKHSIREKDRARVFGRARVAVALSAAVAAVISAAVIATAGSAQGPPHTLHLVATNQKAVGFFPHHKLHQGSRLGFGDKVSGDETGGLRGVCTVIGKRALCNIQAHLSQGNLSLQGLRPLRRASQLPIAVTGGTGRYDGAGGTASVTEVGAGKARITVTLVP